MSKNLLSENMLRFGTKNLSEKQERELVVKSIMETINQHGLHSEVRSRLMEQVNTSQVAKEFVAAGKGLGTDESGMVRAIMKLKDAKQFYMFAKSVKNLTGGSVFSYFNSEMSYADMAQYNKIVSHVKKITGGKVDLQKFSVGDFNHWMYVMRDSFNIGGGGGSSDIRN